MEFDDDILPPSTRIEGWPERLAAFLEERAATPFAWGTHDCCRFAADWVRVATGHDYFGGYVGYSTALEAARLVADAGGLAAIASAHLGASIAPSLAQRGDVVLIDIEGRASLAICVGTEAAGAGETGVARVPMVQGVMAWRV